MGKPDAMQMRLAQTGADRRGAERLRYRVFVEELGGDGPLIDHAGRYERDTYDDICDQLILVDPHLDPGTHDHVLGVYRLLRGDERPEGMPFYSEAEYDLTPLKTSGRRLLELGRSCVAPRLRGGRALFRLWQGLAQYVLTHEVEVMFGTASFHGTDLTQLAQPLSQLHHAHLAPPSMRPRSLQPVAMDMLPEAELDRVAAMRDMPPLIKAYLRIGGMVGAGAFVDAAFNTVDVCLVVDTERMSARHRALYTGEGP